jgi:Putative DNA-binding domain
MTTLAAQQQALLDALFASPGAHPMPEALPFQGVRGLVAYRSNARAQACRCLGTTYPVLAHLLGDDNLAGLAGVFWLAHPPQTGDLAQWGGALAGFLSELPQLADEPWLADVARVEWALHQAGSAADRTFEPQSFALLTAHPPDRLRVVVASGLQLVRSRFPIVDLLGADAGQAPTPGETDALPGDGGAQTAVVWRQGMRPRVARCDTAASHFLQATLDSGSLATALDRAPGFAFDQWLAQAVQSGLVLGVARMDP